mgnify:FL=1
MDPIPIQIQCYSGHKADERPLRFVCEDIEIEVEEVFDQWMTASKEPGQPASDYFKVRGNDGHDYLLRHDQGSDDWFVVNRW